MLKKRFLESQPTKNNSPYYPFSPLQTRWLCLSAFVAILRRRHSSLVTRALLPEILKQMEVVELLKYNKQPQSDAYQQYRGIKKWLAECEVADTLLDELDF